MVSLREIKNALVGIQQDSQDTERLIDEAIGILAAAQEAMNTISVCGRHDVDALLGCMIGIDLLIGEDKNGR
jgi:hypothetical protein